MTKNQIYIALCIILMIASFILGWYLHKCPKESIRTNTTQTTKITPQEPVKADSVPAKIIYRDHYVQLPGKEVSIKDTIDRIIQQPDSCRPYIASLDTVNKRGDTLNIKFYHPEKFFSYNIRLHPDTTRTITNEIKITEEYMFSAGPYVGVGTDGSGKINIQYGIGIHWNAYNLFKR